MKSNYKQAMKLNHDVELTRANLKLFLLALRQSEGYGKERLTRVIYEFCELSSEIADVDDMLIVDDALKSAGIESLIEKIGKQRFDIDKAY